MTTQHTILAQELPHPWRHPGARLHQLHLLGSVALPLGGAMIDCTSCAAALRADAMPVEIVQFCWQYNLERLQKLPELAGATVKFPLSSFFLFLVWGPVLSRHPSGMSLDGCWHSGMHSPFPPRHMAATSIWSA
jgi:hypothetical protein